jgi:DNA invertase Pin-like site-specific DNA recombinase
MNARDSRPTAKQTRRTDEATAALLPAPASPSRPPKIQPWHLERLAVVYVRQSSQYQVIHNKESAQVQSGFRNLAMAWGWPSSRVIVVDHDQAQTGTSSEARTGFQWIMTEVNLNHVGIILGFQMSRLARANADWYHLLDRCAVFHTLLADQDGIYDPTTYNDRLLLGLKGTMSEAELHLLGQRLYEARLNKARRGEQFTSAPTGYVRSPCGNHLELDPDEQVQHVVRLIFDKFDELGSVGAVLRYLVRHDIKLGFRAPAGSAAGQVQWRPAFRLTLNRIFRHPYYAGCYAFGFTHCDPRRRRPGHPNSGMVQVEPLKWQIMIPDAVPAYITWQRYLSNRERIVANRSLPNTPGVRRGRRSVLSGLVYCGRCGKRMRVSYHTKGSPVYYQCDAARTQRDEPICQSITGTPLETLVSQEVLLAIEPARLELSMHAIADLARERKGLDQHWQQRLERARIETDRTARQYHVVEPENRLVARELERRWEQALEGQRQLEEEYDRFLAERPRELSREERQRIEALAVDIPGLWHAPSTSTDERQEIVRCLVERITVTVRGETELVDVAIRWAGGVESRHEIRRPVRTYQQLSFFETLRDRMVELRRAGATTAEIAERLNHEGFHPPRGPDRFNRHVVNQFLTRLGLLGPKATRRISPKDLRPGEWTITDLASKLEMPAITLRHWHYHGWVRARKSSEVGGCWILWADQEELGRLRRLRAWRRTAHQRRHPPELTTPRPQNSRTSNSKANTKRGSRGNSHRTQARKHR